MKTSFARYQIKPRAAARLLAAASSVLLCTGVARATDYSYGSITEDFTLTATDQARVLGAGVTSGGAFNDNGTGSVFDRGSDQDAVYMHFNLASLAGTTINGDVNLNLTVDATYGGAINNGIIGTAGAAWNYPGNAPGISTFSPVSAPNATFTTGQTATWTIGSSTFSSFLGDLANFHGLAVTAEADSKAHFISVATLTGNYSGGEIRVTGATDWSAATWDNGTKTLSITGASDVTGGNVAMVAGTTLLVGGSSTLGGGSFSGSFACNGTLSFGSAANQALSGAIYGSGALVKAGNGTLTLSGSIQYKGGTTVDGGTLELPGGDWVTGQPWNASGATGAITVGSGATLSTSSGVTQVQNGLTLNGGTVSSRGLGYDGSWGNLFLTSNITAGGSATSTIDSQINLSGSRTITVGTGSTLNLTGKLNSWNSGGSGITKDGTGTLVLSGANGYSGVTYVNAGTLVADNGTALGSGGWSSSTMTWVYDGATLSLQGGISLDEHMHVFGAGVGGQGAIRSLSGNNALTMMFNGGGSGPGFSIDSNTTVGVDADTLTATGFYETGGSFGLTKVGAGKLVLTQISTYTGGTTVNEGTLELAAYSGNGRIRDALTINANGTVETTGDGTGLGYYDQISSVAINGGTLTTAGTMHVWNIPGGVTMNGGTLQSNGGTTNSNGPQLEWNRTNLITLASADTATVAGRIRMRDTGSYTGITFDVAEGAAATDLLVSAAISEASGGMGITKSGAGTMLVTGAATYTGPTTISGGTLQFGDGASGGSIASSAISNNASLVLNPAANVTLPQVISGSGSLTKQGSSTITLSGPNTYTGDTIVNGGTLELLNNSATVVQATVTNAGFETPDYTNQGYAYLSTDGIPAWTFAGGGIGSNGSPWLTTAPEGDQAGFIQLNGSITQTITVTTAGDYVVRFMAANRPGYTASDLTVSIDATQVGAWSAAQLATGGNFVSRVSAPITLSPGTYTLTFTGSGSGDTATAIDAVSVSSPPNITNGSLTFKPWANTVSNKITGTGGGTVHLNGLLSLDLSSAAVGNGNSWLLVDHANINESYQSNFRVTSNLGAFTNNSGEWTLVDGSNTWKFRQSDGTLSLAVTGSDPFQNWIDTGWPSLSDKTPGGDPDNDGIPNILEYVLYGGDPSVSSTGILPVADASDPTDVVFTLYRRNASAADTTQVFQHGTDLGATPWTDLAIPGGSGVAVNEDTPSPGIDEVIVTVPKNGEDHVFGRLHVTKPAP